MTKHCERTILVTGATGIIHSGVVRQLASSYSDQYHVKGAAHSQDQADRFKDNNDAVDLVKIDYNRPETVDDALQNIDSFSSLVEQQFAMELTEFFRL